MQIELEYNRKDRQKKAWQTVWINEWFSQNGGRQKRTGEVEWLNE